MILMNLVGADFQQVLFQVFFIVTTRSVQSIELLQCRRFASAQVFSRNKKNVSRISVGVLRLSSIYYPELILYQIESFNRIELYLLL